MCGLPSWRFVVSLSPGCSVCGLVYGGWPCWMLSWIPQTALLHMCCADPGVKGLCGVLCWQHPLSTNSLDRQIGVGPGQQGCRYVREDESLKTFGDYGGESNWAIIIKTVNCTFLYLLTYFSYCFLFSLLEMLLPSHYKLFLKDKFTRKWNEENQLNFGIWSLTVEQCKNILQSNLRSCYKIWFGTSKKKNELWFYFWGF